MFNKLSLKSLDVKGKKVVVRVDYNVPLNPDGSIADTKKIEETLPTLLYLMHHGAKIILISHLGKPAGEKQKKFSLEVIAKGLSSLLHKKIAFIDDCQGESVEKSIENLPFGEIALLENLRFYKAEEDPEIDLGFAKNLSRLGDVFINDAFGASHRKHSSIVNICDYFKGRCAMGFLMEKEIKELNKILISPSRPFFAIIGGSKVSSKLKLLLTLLEKVDALFIGGGMAFTFFKFQRRGIGNSLCEPSLINDVKNILEKSTSLSVPIYLPVDLVVAKSFSNEAPSKIVTIDEGVPEGWQGLDIGPKTISSWKGELIKGSTIFWNGPLGVFEFPQFAKGTCEIASELSSLDATTIVGGGDSAAAIAQLGLEKKFTYISTGGGASIEFLEKGTLPGIEALSS